MNQKLNVSIITMGAELSGTGVRVFDQLMDNGAIVWLNGYDTRYNTRLLEYFDHRKYRNVRVCYCNHDGEVTPYKYWTSEWTQVCFSDESETSLLYGPLKECDLCIMLTEKEIKGSSVSVLEKVVTHYKKPVNVIHTGSNYRNNLDFCIIPDTFAHLIGIRSDTELQFWKYLDIRNTSSVFPNVLQVPSRQCDFDGDMIPLKKV